MDTFIRSTVFPLVRRAVVVLLVAAPIFAADKDQYTDREFEAILNEAAELAHYKKKVEMTARSGGGELQVVDSIEKLGDSRWRVMVTVYDYESGSTQSIYIHKYPVVIYNEGSRYETAFLTPEIPGFLFERALENKYMQEAKEDYQKKHKDVRIEYGRDENRVAIATTYSYAGGVSAKDIRNRLEEMLVASSWIGRMAPVATRLSKKDHQEALQKGEPTHLSKEEVPLLLAVKLDDFVKEDDEDTDGYWRFRMKGRSIEVINYGDRLVFAHDLNQGELSFIARAAVEVTMKKWVEKNAVKGATSTEVQWHPDNNDYLQVKATYALAGKLKGEKIRDGYFDFRDKYSVKFDGEVEDIIKKVSSP